MSRVRAVGATYATIILDFGGMGAFALPHWRLARNACGDWMLISDPIDLVEAPK